MIGPIATVYIKKCHSTFILHTERTFDPESAGQERSRAPARTNGFRRPSLRKHSVQSITIPPGMSVTSKEYILGFISSFLSCFFLFSF